MDGSNSSEMQPAIAAPVVAARELASRVMAESQVGPAAASVYQYNWDRLRVICSLDILGLHLTGSHLFGGVGLPTFFIVTIALAVRGAKLRDSAEFLQKRASRVLVPWLFWSALLTPAYAAYVARRGEPTWSWVKPAMLLYGPEIHLWFLPFSVAAAFAAHLAHRATRARALHQSAGLGFLLACIGLAVGPSIEGGWPLEQWAFSVPGVALGFGLGRMLSTKRDFATTRLELTLLAAAFVLGALVLEGFLPQSSDNAERYAIALSLVTAAMWLPNRPDPFTRHITPLLLGVYILHMLVHRELIEPLIETHGLAFGRVELIAMVYVLTLATVYLLRQTALRRVL